MHLLNNFMPLPGQYVLPLHTYLGVALYFLAVIFLCQMLAPVPVHEGLSNESQTVSEF